MSELTGPIIVESSPLILAGLAHEWPALDANMALAKGADKDPAFRAQTVLELQEVLHAHEISRITQPVQVSVSVTPPAGFRKLPVDKPVLRDGDAGTSAETERVRPKRSRRKPANAVAHDDPPAGDSPAVPGSVPD